MPNTENIDNMIESMINTLMNEYNRVGFLSAATPERKAEIIEEIAKLRDSMNPTTINNIYGPQS